MEVSELDESRCCSIFCYLASAASTRSLRAAITDQEVWDNEFEKEILEARNSTLPGGEDAILSKQKTWDVPLIEINKTLVWSSNNDPLDQARLQAVSAPHAGDWLLTAPIASCGLGLSNEAVRVAIGLHLGLNLCAHTNANAAKQLTQEATTG